MLTDERTQSEGARRRMKLSYRNASFTERLTRDLAVLTTLAHLGCATFSHLQVLCFPARGAETARLGLANLRAAGYLTHSTWFLQQATGVRGQVWTLTPKGLTVLQRYAPLPTAHPPLALACPRTPVEYDAWQAGLRVRSLVIALILEARRTAFLTSLRVTLPSPWLTTLDAAGEPDALLQIDWQAPRVQPAAWLPWLACWTTTPPTATALQYAVYRDR